MVQKLDDMGALIKAEGVPSVLRSDLATEERMLAHPLETTYYKCKKLKDSLYLEYDRKDFELQIEIAEFNTKLHQSHIVEIMQEIEVVENLQKDECDAAFRRQYEQELVKLREELANFQQLLVKLASSRAMYEQQLPDLDAQGESPGLVPVTPPHASLPPPPPVVEGPMALLLEAARIKEEKLKAEADNADGTAAASPKKSK